MKKKQVTWGNYVRKEGKKFKEPSMCEPGQVLSVEEIVKKHGAGIPAMEDYRQEWADIEEMMPRFQDLTDIDESKAFVERVREKLASVDAELEKEEKVQEKPPEEVAEVEEDTKE